MEILSSLESVSVLSETLLGGGESAVGFQIPNESFVKDFLKYIVSPDARGRLVQVRKIFYRGMSWH